MKCPNHESEMVPKRTEYGVVLNCHAPGCTMAYWPGHGVATPADKETRALRHQCHLAFDPLWQCAPRHFQSRGLAYKWLGRILRLHKDLAHIGLMDAAQCRQLLAEIAKLSAGARASH